MSNKHKQQSILKEIINIKTSPHSPFHWKNHFHKNPLDFGIYADFEADNEIDIASIGNRTNNKCKRNPVYKGFEILSEREDVWKRG